MNLETLLSGIFALGLPAWLLVEQLIHWLGTPSRVEPPQPVQKAEEPRALHRAA